MRIYGTSGKHICVSKRTRIYGVDDNDDDEDDDDVRCMWRFFTHRTVYQMCISKKVIENICKRSIHYNTKNYIKKWEGSCESVANGWLLAIHIHYVFSDRWPINYNYIHFYRVHMAV